MFIIATVEKYLLTENHIRKIILAGTDIIRFNLSYHTTNDNIDFINNSLQIINELNASTKIFIDFPINKARLGDFDTKLFSVKEGEELTFKSNSFSLDCYEYIPVALPELGRKVTVGQNITIGDGELSLQVIEIIDNSTIRVKMQNRGIIQYMKTFNIPQTFNEEMIIEEYNNIINKISIIDAHYLAIPYFNPPLLKAIIGIIHKNNLDTKIGLKIEKEIPNDELETIFKNNDFTIVLIDRGEIGVNMPYYKIGIYQKIIIKLAHKYKKRIIITTQILESTMNNFVPNRAEIMDLTNSVIDGIDGIMLCRETAINHRAAYTISVAKKIIAEAEMYKKHIANI